MAFWNKFVPSLAELVPTMIPVNPPTTAAPLAPTGQKEASTDKGWIFTFDDNELRRVITGVRSWAQERTWPTWLWVRRSKGERNLRGNYGGK